MEAVVPAMKAVVSAMEALMSAAMKTTPMAATVEIHRLKARGRHARKRLHARQSAAQDHGHCRYELHDCSSLLLTGSLAIHISVRRLCGRIGSSLAHRRCIRV
jgi:hypothetical protein